MCGHEHKHHGRRRRWERGFERDLEAQIQESVRQAQVTIDRDIGPAVEAVRRHVREMDIQGIIDAAIGKPVSAAVSAVGGDATPPAPAHTEERLAILRMVEEGKLSPDDAARLLDAL